MAWVSGTMTLASAVPAITQNQVSSCSNSIALLTAWRVWMIFSPSIEPEQSTIRASTSDCRAPAKAGAAAVAEPDVTLITACTRSAPCARY